MKYTQYPIAVGPDQGELYFAYNSVLAYARVGEKYVFCQHDYDESGVLHYSHYNDYLPLREEDVVLSRRLFIDFDNMHDNEIDCRYHAYSLMKKEVGSIYRVTEVDEGNEEVSWYISIPKMAPIFKTTPWSDEQQMKVSTGCFKEVDRLCNELRISVVCNKDLQKELEWTASSPLYSNMVMKSKNRSRAVIQLVLWAFYSRTPFSYVGQQKVEQLLKSHKTDIEDILYERGNA